MMLRSIRKLKNLKGKTVLLRADFNVPVTNGRVDASEDFRLERVVPTIKFLLRRGARVIILSHRGRPEGKVREDLRLAPVAKRLRKLLVKSRKSKVENQNIFQNSAFKILGALFPAYAIVPRVTMLENLRFDSREEANDAKFAKTLASLGDIYVNDAFAVSHRKNASVHAITKYLSSYAGLLMEEELHHLSSIFQKPLRPLVVILGGAKISTKIGLIEKFLPHADHVLLGGALANTLLKAQGYQVGKSLVENPTSPTIRGGWEGLLTNPRLNIPIDIVVAKSVKGKTRIAAAADVRTHESIFDIGPKTVDLFSSLATKACMIVWNGPLGLFEEKKFAKSTFDVLAAVLKNTKAKTIIGGGETVTAYRQWCQVSGVRCQVSNVFLSTGGGAMLEYLEQGTLPCIKVLQHK